MAEGEGGLASGDVHLSAGRSPSSQIAESAADAATPVVGVICRSVEPPLSHLLSPPDEHRLWPHHFVQDFTDSIVLSIVEITGFFAVVISQDGCKTFPVLDLPKRSIQIQARLNF